MRNDFGQKTLAAPRAHSRAAMNHEEPRPSAPGPRPTEGNAGMTGLEQIGQYRIIKFIGKGGMGEVFLAHHTVLERRCALKFMPEELIRQPGWEERFKAEARTLARLDHRNIVRLHGAVADVQTGKYYLEMELVDGGDLEKRIARARPGLDEEETRRVLDEILDALDYAHGLKVVHRDLKPANILINDEGLLKIVDFGVAAAASSGDTQLTKTGYVIGSPKYMAPEQILGKKVDHRADIYSVGVILYEMLAGVPPYTKGDHMSVMYQHVQGKAKPCEEINPAIPAPLAAIVRKAMEVDKLKRFESMDALREALEQAA
jgi:serine/threonine-protein kinase